MKSSRRTFLKSTAALAATAALARSGRAAVSAQRALAVTPQLDQFGYGDVTLLEGPLRQQFDTNHAFYGALNEDSLLKPYRERAGLPAPGEDMGGWYDWVDDFSLQNMHGFCPGHSFGQYVSGLSRDYAATGDRATQEKVHRLVAAFGPAISEHFFEGNRFPAYIYDKITVGMIDAHQFTGSPDAFKALDAALTCARPHLPPRALSRDEQYARPHKDESWCWDEPYTLPENQFLAWQRGAGDKYRELATHYLADDWYWNPLASGENVLPGKHAYSHVNAMSSAMQAYFVLGDEKYLRAARNGFGFVQAQSFATGGWGPNEGFRKPGSGEIGESLTSTHSSFETPCGSYAHFKITRYLLRITRDSRYGDSMERVLYNTVLGAKPIEKDGHGFYYSDYNNDGSKFYHPDKWHCCTGTFSEITADYGISAYFHDAGGLYVNLYVPSRVQWRRGSTRIALTQQTSYPHMPTTQLEVTTSAATAFPVYLRIPAWAGPTTTISINGKRALAAPTPGKFAKLERTWKTGDRIEVEFDIPTVLEPVDAENPNLVAAVHGPLALFSVSAIPSDLTRADLQRATQIAAGSTEWQVKTADGTLALRPFTAINDEHYRLYLDLKS